MFHPQFVLLNFFGVWLEKEVRNKGCLPLKYHRRTQHANTLFTNCPAEKARSQGSHWGSRCCCLGGPRAQSWCSRSRGSLNWAVITNNSENLSGHHNKGLFCVHKDPAADGNDFLGQVVYMCRFSERAASTLRLQFLTLPSSVIAAAWHESAAGSEKGSPLWKPGSNSGPWARTGHWAQPSCQGVRRSILHVPRRVKSQTLVSTCKFYPLKQWLLSPLKNYMWWLYVFLMRGEGL